MGAITNFFDRLVQRYLPDAYLFAIILTFIVFFLGVIFTEHYFFEQFLELALQKTIY
ncbi:MAG: short-chain fatty acid transporter, partial [Caldibacillus sp.]